jgi:hypothetical protein
MRLSSSPVLAALLFSFTTIGCGMLAPQQPAQQPQQEQAASSSTPPKYVVPKESQELLRKGEQDAYAKADDAADEELDRQEKAALKAIKVALGKEASFQGGPTPEAASTAIKSIRAAKLKLRLEAVTDADGKAVNDDFLQVKDSFTDRVQQLNRKITEGKASKAEMKEIQKGAKQAMKLNDVKMAVNGLSMQVMMTNNNVQSQSLQTMFRVSGMAKSRKQMEMELNDADYALIRRGLERQKRAEAIAATTLAMMAAFQAVINDNNSDPSAIDVIGEATLKAFPVKAPATDEDAKQYVSQLGANIEKVKAKYEAGLRKVHGDERYEKKYKAGVDGMFAQADTKNVKTVNQIMTDTATKYKEDVIKCKRGEDPGPGSMVGSCKAIHHAAMTGDTSDLPPGAKKVFDETGGANPGAGGGGGGGGGGGSAPVGAKLGTKETAAINGAVAASKGDVDGMLDAAGKLFPGDSTIGASLQGIAALKKGDAKGAINAALSFVPVPGLKDAFGIASKLLFKS